MRVRTLAHSCRPALIGKSNDRHDPGYTPGVRVRCFRCGGVRDSPLTRGSHATQVCTRCICNPFASPARRRVVSPLLTRVVEARARRQRTSQHVRVLWFRCPPLTCVVVPMVVPTWPVTPQHARPVRAQAADPDNTGFVSAHVLKKTLMLHFNVLLTPGELDCLKAEWQVADTLTGIVSVLCWFCQ
jgi:hypothetical protein